MHLYVLLHKQVKFLNKTLFLILFYHPNRSRPKDRPYDKTRKDKRDSRSRDRERERERERRIAREEREAAREKEREEALARCQERQRERERLKELAKKEEERRARDRGRRGEDRGLDKPPSDRVERLLPLPADRIPPGRSSDSVSDKDRERSRRERSGERSRGGNSRKSADRHDRDIEKDRLDYAYDRERHYDRERERDRDLDRDYPVLPARVRDLDRRHDEKAYDSPYSRARHDDRVDRRYTDIDDHYNDASRDAHLPIDARDYPDEHRARRDLWDERERELLERDRELEHRRYREDSRPPQVLKPREWEADYAEHEWDRARRPLEWEARDNWEGLEHEQAQLEEEWRHYNRSLDSWAAAGEDRRRWPADWRDRERERERDRSRPRSSTSHREGKFKHNKILIDIFTIWVVEVDLLNVGIGILSSLLMGRR